MLFNSFEFIFLFLPVTFYIYYFFLKQRLVVGAKSFLILASLFFYSWWNIAYLPLLILSILFNFIIGNVLNDNFHPVHLSKKYLLTFGILGNLSLLGYFKYSHFFIDNYNVVFDTSFEFQSIILPLAISFFTFQQIMYLVDSFQNKTREYSFLNYSLFVTFFPQLIAGPIVHHANMMPQFASRWNLVKNYKNIAMGLFIFSLGLFKKVIIADTLSQWSAMGFAAPAMLGFFDAWATSLSYTFQLYFDFSGYTDMALGLALLFNIKLPINFNSPYRANNIQDFWQRWHITLSQFFKNYVYIPLGGNKKGDFRTVNNILFTFLLGGLWHGAGWTFIFWGFMHAMALLIYRFWKKLGFTLNVIVAWFITFNFINITWIFFRANEWQDASRILKGMMGLNGIDVSHSFRAIYINTVFKLSELFPTISAHKNSQFLFSFDTYFFIGVCFFIVLRTPNSLELVQNFHIKNKNRVKLTLFYSIIFFLSLLKMMMVPSSEFLYFDF
ncbi:MAG: MBOAT family protein [Gammaproteobacteria bacterium]|nr:MBOAT family protein [Gammaproteobacteria bacterium]